jgi:AcrR family transcriptional regulator
MVALVKPDSDQAETRQLLLEAAGEVFAEAGFRSATVREICQRAGANIAAIHYHFGDKERLYSEVLRFAYHQAVQKYPPDLGVQAGAGVEERLRAFVRAFLLRIFDQGRFAWRGKLIAREMIEPTRALDSVVKEEMQPQAVLLSSIIRQALGPAASEETVRWCGCSIVSQCVFYHHCQPVIARLFPKQKFGPDEVEALARHITQFSLSALKQMSKRSKGASR